MLNFFTVPGEHSISFEADSMLKLLKFGENQDRVTIQYDDEKQGIIILLEHYCRTGVVPYQTECTNRKNCTNRRTAQMVLRFVQFLRSTRAVGPI